MNCQEVMDYMQRQLDGDLDERETEILMNHTRHCSDCAAMFERLKMLSSGLESLPKVTPSYSLVDAILPKLAEIQAESDKSVEQPMIVIAGEAAAAPRRVQKPASSWRRWLPLSAVGGAVAAGVIIGMFYLSNNSMHSLRDSANSGLTADTSSASNNAAVNANRVNSDSSADSAAGADEKAVVPKGNSDVAAQGAGAANDGAAIEQNMASKIKPDRSGSVDPNGEAMPPITSGGGQDNDIAADQAKSPNYSRSSDGAASGNAPAADSNSVPFAANTDQSGGSEDGAADSTTSNEGSVPGADNKMDAVAPQVMASPISPDKQYQAFIVDDAVIIYTVSDSELKFQGGTRAGISDLKWSEDGKQLTYTAVDADGATKTYVVDPEAGTEQVQSSK